MSFFGQIIGHVTGNHIGAAAVFGASVVLGVLGTIPPAIALAGTVTGAIPHVIREVLERRDERASG